MSWVSEHPESQQGLPRTDPNEEVFLSRPLFSRPTPISSWRNQPRPEESAPEDNWYSRAGGSRPPRDENIELERITEESGRTSTSRPPRTFESLDDLSVGSSRSRIGAKGAWMLTLLLVVVFVVIAAAVVAIVLTTGSSSSSTGN